MSIQTTVRPGSLPRKQAVALRSRSGAAVAIPQASKGHGLARGPGSVEAARVLIGGLERETDVGRGLLKDMPLIEPIGDDTYNTIRGPPLIHLVT